MDWYYLENGAQAGPVTEEGLEELVRLGVVKPETVVWRTGLAGWIPYSQAASGAGTATATLDPPAAQGWCGECGRQFPLDDLVRFGDRSVCGNCKEAFTQRLREGVAPRGAMRYAGFWRRFVAAVADGIILFVFSMVLNMAVAMLMPAAARNGGSPFAALGLTLIMLVFQIAAAAGYEGFFVGRLGATPGKMALHVKVVMANGGQLSMGRAFGRYFAKWLSSITFLIGYIMAGFDAEKRALHDHICGTRVIEAS